MKTFTKIIAALTFTFTAATAVNATEFEATDSYVTTDLCMAAAEGNKLQMNKAIKSSKLSKHFIVENVKCNDQDFLAFTARFNDNSDSIMKLMGNEQKRSITITDMVAN